MSHLEVRDDYFLHHCVERVATAGANSGEDVYFFISTGIHGGIFRRVFFIVDDRIINGDQPKSNILLLCPAIRPEVPLGIGHGVHKLNERIAGWIIEFKRERWYWWFRPIGCDILAFVRDDDF